MTKKEDQDEERAGDDAAASSSQDNKSTVKEEQKYPIGRVAGDGAETVEVATNPISNAAAAAAAAAAATAAAAGPPTRGPGTKDGIPAMPGKSRGAKGKQAARAPTSAKDIATSVIRARYIQPEPSADEPGSEGEQEDAGKSSPEPEFRLTMIQSVREAVNKICEQAVEKTRAMVRGGFKRSEEKKVDPPETAGQSSNDFPSSPIPYFGRMSSSPLNMVSFRSN